MNYLGRIRRKACGVVLRTRGPSNLARPSKKARAIGRELPGAGQPTQATPTRSPTTALGRDEPSPGTGAIGLDLLPEVVHKGLAHLLCRTRHLIQNVFSPFFVGACGLTQILGVRWVGFAATLVFTPQHAIVLA